MTYKNGDIYEGSWCDCKKNGFGKKILKNGESCECEWLNGKPQGKAIYKNKDGESYECNLEKDEPQVMVKKTYADDTVDKRFWMDECYIYIR